MSFLAPLFLAGAAAIALPFIFHLIRRSAKEKIPFSSLMFLEASPPRITKRSRLEHLLLLLLRCLAICLLAMAFARPFLSKPLASAAMPETSLHLAVVVDASASMQREDLWEQAKERAVRTVRQASAGTQVGLYIFDDRLRSVVTFSESAELSPSEAAAEMETRLDALKPGFGATHLGNALTGAAEELMDQLNREQHEFGSARIVLISDLQAGAKLDGLQGYEWPERMQVEVVALSAENPGNAGLHLLQPEARLAFTSTNAPPRIRVQNSEGATREQFRVSWADNGIPMGEPVSIYVPPGESRIISPEPAPARANQLVLLDDAVDFDNRAWWTAEKAQDTAILYHGTDAENSPQQPLYFLKRAFELPGSTLKVTPLGSTGTNMAGLMVATEPLSQAAQEKARELIEAGRTVLAVVNRPEIASSLAPLLGLTTLPAAEGQVRNYALLGEIDFTHPLFRPFAEARYSDFTKIHFWKYRQLDTSLLTNPIVAARFDSGDPFLVDIPVGKGRVLIMTSGWAPSESQFALSSKFVPFLYGVLEQSMGEEGLSQQFLVGHAVALPDSVGEVEDVIGPDNTRMPLTEAGLSQPGLYRVGEPPRYTFAVNVDPSETRVHPMSAEDLDALGIPLGETASSPLAEQLAATRQQHRLASEAEAQQKLWRWLLLGAVAVLFAEMLYAGRLSRTVTPP